MISFEDATRIVLASAEAAVAEAVPLCECLNRVLARDVRSDSDIPAHDFSTMDGFACRRVDLDGGIRALRPIGTVCAGTTPNQRCGPGECMGIMTGAVVPPGCDTVVMIEDTEERDGFVHVVERQAWTNIRYKAEDLRAGDLVLAAGTALGPAQIAVLAAVGCDPVEVHAMLRVGIVATGDELVEPSETPAAGKIRNSNSCQLSAQVRRAGCGPVYFGIVRDSPEAIAEVLKRAAAQCDVILFSGGVSMGDHDFVPNVLKSNGFQPAFEKVKIKPGRPTVFGKKDRTYFFGLPGNPVSTFVIFEVLVRPLLMLLMGGEYRPLRVGARLAETFRRRQIDRPEFVPVRLTDGTAQLPEYHGSAHIHAYVGADGMILIPEGVGELGAGTAVEVRLIG